MTKRESNILKCVAIMLMLFHHLFMYADQADYPALIYGPLLSNPWRLASAGQLSKLCVTIFVFITAYGTARSYLGDDMKDCSRLMEKSTRRLVKLLVNFQFVYIIAALLCPLSGKNWLTLYSPSRLENLVFALFDFMGVSFIINTPSYNSSWWYMSLAVTFVLTLPLLIKLCRRYGFFVLLPEILLVRWLNVNWVIYRYLLPAVVGILLAEYRVIERVIDTYIQSGVLKKAGFYLGIFIVLGLGSVLWLRAGDGLLDIYETVLLLPVVLFTLLTLARIPYVNRAAEFVGRHSMNMFFIHAFIYQNWFHDFTYSLKYPALIYLFLFASSLAASVLIEQLKKWLRVEELTRWISNRLCRLLVRQAETV